MRSLFSVGLSKENVEIMDNMDNNKYLGFDLWNKNEEDILPFWVFLGVFWFVSFSETGFYLKASSYF